MVRNMGRGPSVYGIVKDSKYFRYTSTRPLHRIYPPSKNPRPVKGRGYINCRINAGLSYPAGVSLLFVVFNIRYIVDRYLDFSLIESKYSRNVNGFLSCKYGRIHFRVGEAAISARTNLHTCTFSFLLGGKILAHRSRRPFYAIIRLTIDRICLVLIIAYRPVIVIIGIADIDIIPHSGCQIFIHLFLGHGPSGNPGILSGNKDTVLGKLLVLIPSLAMYGHRLRLKGLKETLEREYPTIHMEECVELSSDEISDYRLTTAKLKEYPDTDLIICPGAFGTGCLTAIKDSGFFGKTKIIAYDCSRMINKALEDRNVMAIIAQQPSLQGYTAMKTMFSILIGSGEIRHDNYIKTRILLREHRKEIHESTKTAEKSKGLAF